MSERVHARILVLLYTILIFNIHCVYGFAFRRRNVVCCDFLILKYFYFSIIFSVCFSSHSCSQQKCAVCVCVSVQYYDVKHTLKRKTLPPQVLAQTHGIYPTKAWAWGLTSVVGCNCVSCFVNCNVQDGENMSTQCVLHMLEWRHIYWLQHAAA